jgi:hypothetical protein
MRLNSITANRHIFDGQVNGKPLRLLLTFDNDRTLRLQVAGDGERMIVDDGPLDAPFDMDGYGQMDIADVTLSLFPALRGVEVAQVAELAWNGRRVGVRLNADGGDPFHFWADGDELHWGDEAALIGHDWLGGVAPRAAERIEV